MGVSPFQAVLDGEPIRVPGSQLGVVHQGSIFQGVPGGDAQGVQVPDDISDLIQDLLSIQVVSLKDVLLDQVCGFSRFTCQSQSSIEQELLALLVDGAVGVLGISLKGKITHACLPAFPPVP